MPKKVDISFNNGPYTYDQRNIEDIRLEYAKSDEQRENVIKKSREILKASKQCIYSLHRGDLNNAENLLKTAENVAQELGPLIKADPYLRNGGYTGALEEYAEARTFYGFLKNGSLPSLQEIKLINRDEYLGGLFDFTGELNRFVIVRATERDMDTVKHCRDLLDNLFYDFLQFDFRNGNLRKKYDSVKYTIKKIENTIYELSLLEGMNKKELNRMEVEEDPVKSNIGLDDQ